MSFTMSSAWLCRSTNQPRPLRHQHALAPLVSLFGQPNLAALDAGHGPVGYAGQTMVTTKPPSHPAREDNGFLAAAGLSKSFDGAPAVNDVSFSIGRREIFGLLGPNGAGKTTTIRMLSTVLAPDAGDVTIGGHSVLREADEVRKIIGVCPQELALYEELSARDNLVFFGRMAGLGARQAKAAAAENLELVGLLDRASDAVRKFSGGMKRRVNLAVALMSRPRLLFLDEPTVGVDPQSRNHIFETILRLRDEGMTVLYTTHYMEEADRLCDNIGVMDHGRLIALDTPVGLKSAIGDPDEVTLEQVFLNLTGRSLRD